MGEIEGWLRSPEALWLLCGAVALWLAFRWGRGAWRQIDARRRRRAFDAREARRWQDHRRESTDVTRLRKK